MKGLLIFVALLVGGFLYAKNWVTSGQMDNYLTRTQNPRDTPKRLDWIGQISVMMQDTKSVIHYYGWLVRDFPEYEKVDKARWHLGNAYEEIRDKTKAMEQYDVLISSFPKTEYGQLGMGRIQKLRY